METLYLKLCERESLICSLSDRVLWKHRMGLNNIYIKRVGEQLCWISRCHKEKYLQILFPREFKQDAIKVQVKKPVLTDGRDRYPTLVLLNFWPAKSGSVSQHSARMETRGPRRFLIRSFTEITWNARGWNRRMRVADECRLVDDATRHAVGWHYDTHAAARRCFQTQSKRVGGWIARSANWTREASPSSPTLFIL